jgi:hypothetical protein
MKRSILITSTIFVMFGAHGWSSTISSAMLTSPFALQPTSLMQVDPGGSGVAGTFFSDISGLGFPSQIVDVLSNLVDLNTGDPLTSAEVTGITVLQGSNTFNLPGTCSSPCQVTVDPANFNLAFAFDSDSTFQYSYELQTTGLAPGDFLTFDDVEAAQTPEPGTWLLFAAAVAAAGAAGGRRRVYAILQGRHHRR